MTADQDGMITTDINTDISTGVIKVPLFFILFLILLQGLSLEEINR